jgi:hypothetical protein
MDYRTELFLGGRCAPATVAALLLDPSPTSGDGRRILRDCSDGSFFGIIGDHEAIRSL